MDEKEFEDQKAGIRSEPVQSEPLLEQVQPMTHIPVQAPQKRNISMISIVGAVIVLVILLVAFFAPWYNVSTEMSALGNEITINADFYLTGFSASSNFPVLEGQGSSWSYDDIIQQGESTNTSNYPRVLDNTMYIVIGAIITAILALICMLGIFLNFGDPNKMRKMGAIFGIITLVLAIVAFIYFMMAFTGLMTDPDGNKITSFWYSKNATLMGIEISISTGPGYAWYLMIVASVIALISSIFLFKKPSTKSLHQEQMQMRGSKKNIKTILAALLIIIVLIVAVFLFLVFQEEQDESSEDISNFIGTWKIDIENSIGYHSEYNYTDETWTFYENKTLKVITVYEYGNGSSTGIFNVKGGQLYLAFDVFDYAFSDNNNLLTLSDSQQIIVLNKFQ